MEQLKICRICNVEKPISEFYKTKDTKDRHRSECRECLKFHKEEYKKNNPEIVKNYKKRKISPDETLKNKICNKCEQEKEIEYFSKSSIHSDGYNPICKKCRSEYKKEYYQKNKEKI